MLHGKVHPNSAGLALLLHRPPHPMLPFPYPELNPQCPGSRPSVLVLLFYGADFSSFVKTQPQPHHIPGSFPDPPQLEQEDSLREPCSTWSFLGGSCHGRHCVSWCPQHSVQGLAQGGAGKHSVNKTIMAWTYFQLFTGGTCPAAGPESHPDSSADIQTPSPAQHSPAQVMVSQSVSLVWAPCLSSW